MFDLDIQNWNYYELAVMTILSLLVILAFITIIIPYAYKEFFKKKR